MNTCLPSYYYCLSVRSYIKHDYDGDVETLITFWHQTRLSTMITSCPSALTLAAEAEKQEPNPWVAGSSPGCITVLPTLDWRYKSVWAAKLLTAVKVTSLSFLDLCVTAAISHRHHRDHFVTVATLWGNDGRIYCFKLFKLIYSKTYRQKTHFNSLIMV